MQLALVVFVNIGRQSTGGGQLIRVVYQGLDFAGCTAKGLKQNALVIGRSAHHRSRHLKAQTVMHHINATRYGVRVEQAGLAVQQAHQARLGWAEDDFVVRGFELAGIGHLRGGSIAPADAVAGDIAVTKAAAGQGKQVCTGYALQSQAALVLLVKLMAYRQRQAPQQVTACHQVIVVVLQQACNFSATHHIGRQLHLGATGLAEVERQLLAAGVFLGFCYRQLARGRTQHQRLAAAHEQADAAIIRRDLAGLHILVDFPNHLVARIQQVIGLVAGGQGAHDFVVQARHLLGHVVDQQHVIANLLLGGVVKLIQHVRRCAKTRGQLIHARQHHIACRGIGGGGLHIDKGIHHLGHGCAYAAFTACKYVLHLHQGLQAHAVRGIGRIGRVGLAVEQFAEIAHDGGHLYALANKSAAARA